MSLNYFILGGPTGIGKSAMGLRLAVEFSVPILSVDSIQVYRGMDIGTAKPSMEERALVPHLLMDVVEPNVEFDASQFLRKADELCLSNEGRMLGVGGTPFYMQALRCGLAGIKTREGYDRILEKMDNRALLRWLTRLDPIRASKIHPHDRFRLVRALLIILSTGRKASQYPELNRERDNCRVRMVALDMPREAMHERIRRRIEHMFACGLLEEARALHQGGRLGRNAAQAVGYKELFAHFDGETSLAEAKDKILFATRQLLKHQMTWLRKLPVHWVQVDEHNPDKAYAEVRALFERYLKNIH